MLTRLKEERSKFWANHSEEDEDDESDEESNEEIEEIKVKEIKETNETEKEEKKENITSSEQKPEGKLNYIKIIFK